MASIDIKGAIAQCLYYSKTALEDEVQYEDDTTKVIATHIPLGVVGAICPWNFPIILSNIKVVSSLITGNCIIVKPSPFTPYAVMKWIELARGILPPGVLQVLNGGADLGALMTSHPGINKISFTGTIATGKRVMASCAKTLKKVTLELAGNDACIVCPDADLDKTIPSVASGGFFHGGQVCVASKRIYVHESIYDEFLDRLVKEVEKSYSITEDATAPSLFGPLSNKVQFDTVKGIFEDCKKNGYKIVTGGLEAKGVPGKGFWLPPTVVDRPPEDCYLVKEEQFGEFTASLPPLVFCFDFLLSPHCTYLVPPQRTSKEKTLLTRCVMTLKKKKVPSSPSSPGPPKMTSSPGRTSPTLASVPPSTLGI